MYLNIYKVEWNLTTIHKWQLSSMTKAKRTFNAYKESNIQHEDPNSSILNHLGWTKIQNLKRFRIELLVLRV